PPPSSTLSPYTPLFRSARDTFSPRGSRGGGGAAGRSHGVSAGDRDAADCGGGRGRNPDKRSRSTAAAGARPAAAGGDNATAGAGNPATGNSSATAGSGIATAAGSSATAGAGSTTAGGSSATPG